ncbi:lysosome membrane protein 2-like [Eriocheir sinensis]|uniref:lysosome membrane protein 2-like n=1 Tax=Eriocheir sinensis TaxID=95602 RepID=UPI0021C5B654|nr:lysosome membrane protein 2-like [Eriocheir sinensis]
MHRSNCLVCLGMLGLLMVVLGVVVTVVFDPLVNSFINQELVIRNGSDMYKEWKNPPVVPHLQVYFFNVTNKEEFLAGDKPVFQEVGPYCYREHWKKVNVKFHNNGSVSYETQKFYFFERNASVGPEEDVITTLNIPMMTALSQWRFAARLAKLALSSMLEVLGTQPFVTKTVGQFMWGYDDPLLKIAKDIIPPDQRLPYEQFGFFIKKNGSTDGLLNVYTGEYDMTKYATINTYNYKNKLHYWKTDSCNKVQGSDGSSFPPEVVRDTTLYMFNENLCRSVPLTYWHNIEDFGIEGMRFSPPPDIFADVSTKPENECYCVGGPPCIGGGVFNISSCKFGSPTLVSWPHFYQADPKYREAVIGLKPNADKHAMFIDLAPRTGTPLRAQARLQINIAVPYVPEVHPAAKLREIIFPVLWFEDGVAELPGNLLELLRLSENTPPVAKLSMLLALYSIGFIIVVFVVIAFLTTHYDLPVPYFNPNFTHREGKTTKVNNTPDRKSHLTGHTNTMVSNDPENDA